MKPSISIDNNKNIRESRNTDTNTLESSVRQRLTSYKHINIYSKKNIVLNFRVSIEYIGKLDFIIEKLKAKNLSEAIRESIDIVYGLLSGAREINTETLVIQNPIVNIVKAEAKAESKQEINLDLKPIIELVNKLYAYRDPLPPYQKKLVERLYKTIEKMVIRN